MIQKPERSTYTALDVIAFRESQALDLTARFQRREVWKTPARSFFIDTLIRGYPVPPIYIRVTQSADKKRTVREVIDGQQRLRALLGFMDGDYSLTSAVGSAWQGRTFAELDVEHQDAIREYPFIFEVLHSVSDREVLEIFARLNTYSVRLNQQELRNGTYFGFFKQTVYGLAHEHIEFWRNNRIFTEARIARMLEVELTSELVIAGLSGLQDKKASVNSFYADNDAAFPDQDRVVDRFRSVIDDISETFGDSLRDTEFRRPPLFYSLFAAVHHFRFGLPGLNVTTPRRRLKQADRRALRDGVFELSDVIALAREEDTVPSKYVRFVTAALRQTDNIQPRRTRTETILRQAF